MTPLEQLENASTARALDNAFVEINPNLNSSYFLTGNKKHRAEKFFKNQWDYLHGDQPKPSDPDIIQDFRYLTHFPVDETPSYKKGNVALVCGAGAFLWSLIGIGAGAALNDSMTLQDAYSASLLSTSIFVPALVAGYKINNSLERKYHRKNKTKQKGLAIAKRLDAIDARLC